MLQLAGAAVDASVAGAAVDASVAGAAVDASVARGAAVDASVAGGAAVDASVAGGAAVDASVGTGPGAAVVVPSADTIMLMEHTTATKATIDTRCNSMLVLFPVFWRSCFIYTFLRLLRMLHVS